MDAIQGKVQNFESNQRIKGIRGEHCQCIERKVQVGQVPHSYEHLRFEDANLILSQHEEAQVQKVLETERNNSFKDCYNVFAIHILSLLTIYLESSWWKVGDMVTKKIEEHQLFCTREGLGVNGLNSILLQVDALNVWN